MSPLVSVVIPSLNRPGKLRDCLEQLLTASPEVEVIVAAHPDDKATQRMVKRLAVVKLVTTPGTSVEAWNIGAAAASGDYLVLGADDLWFYDGWYEAALEAMAKLGGHGLVAFNDLSPLAGRLATHYMVSRNYAVNEWGGFLAAPYYKKQWIDNEATHRARRDERFIYAEDSVVEHMHPVWDKGENDSTYQMAEDNEWYADGEKVFVERMQAGFPNEHEPYFDMRVPEAEGWGSVAMAARVYKYPEPHFMASWTRTMAGGMRRGDKALDVIWGFPGHIAANHYARGFLGTRCNSLLLIDDDMTFDGGALEQLRSNEANWGYDIVMGFCTHKTVPPHAVVMQLHDEQPGPPLSLMGERYGALRNIPNNTVIDVDAVGLAFTLIKRHVLEQMVGEFGTIYTSWFDWGQHSVGEDVVFSQRCRERGFRMAVDTSVKIGHVGDYIFGWSAFNEWQAQENNRET